MVVQWNAYLGGHVVTVARVTKSMRILGTNLMRKVLAIPLIAVLSPLTIAETITVPQEAETIQEAIDLAQGDDVILVSPGRYNETINFKGKAITANVQICSITNMMIIGEEWLVIICRDAKHMN